MGKHHSFEILTRWTGNLGTGTNDYRSYRRDHEIRGGRKATAIAGSSDAAFRGDATRYNPEELLVASLSACHMLWYLHLCADSRIAVMEYDDDATGTMVEVEDGGGHFTEVVLHPRVAITRADQKDEALRLHEEAHRLCFIANSVNFSVRHAPEVSVVARPGR